jgi:hypothetical protein
MKCDVKEFNNIFSESITFSESRKREKVCDKIGWEFDRFSYEECEQLF